MDDFNKPIRPFSKSDDHEIRIEPIEAVGPRKESFISREDEEKLKEKKFLQSSVIILLRKLFNFLIPEKIGLVASDAILEDVKLLLELLIQIRDEAPTDDPIFVEKFSRAWHRLIDHYHHCMQWKKASILDLSKVKIFIDALNVYPPHEDHSLGYYLYRYTEEAWFPVPFFKIIDSLHENYNQSPEKSALCEWISILEALIKKASIKP